MAKYIPVYSAPKKGKYKFTVTMEAGQKLFVAEEVEYVKPQFTSNHIRFTQLSHEGGAYDFGGVSGTSKDEIVMPFDGTILWEGYAKELGYKEKAGTAIGIIVQSKDEIIEGHKAVVWVWHLAKSIYSDGDFVKRNTILGIEGNTGVSFGSHSHVGMAIVPNDWKFENKLPFAHRVDLVKNTYQYPHQVLAANELSAKVTINKI